LQGYDLIPTMSSDEFMGRAVGTAAYLHKSETF